MIQKKKNSAFFQFTFLFVKIKLDHILKKCSGFFSFIIYFRIFIVNYIYYLYLQTTKIADVKL